MTENDDDLPVLTQILRTGNAHPSDVPIDLEHGPEDFDVQPIGDTLMADQLVIGNEPHHEIASYLVPSFDLRPEQPDARSVEAGGDLQAHPVDHSDSFMLPQDHDGPHRSQTTGSTFNEPALVAPAAEDPAVFAAKVRDAVLENLSGRIDTELDARIAQAIHAEVETALAQLQGSLRAQLSDAFKDVVGRAVDEEIARLAAVRSSDSA